MTAPAAPVPCTALVLRTEPEPEPAPSAFCSFFAGVGRFIAETALQVHGSVDPDARRDLLWMPVVGLASIGPRVPKVRPMADDGHRIVVFVHGLAGYPGNFMPMRAWLRLHGRTRTYAVGLAGGKTIREQARTLRRFIAEVVEANELPPGAQIDLVAHSMGGLVSRLAIQDAETSERIHTFVTLGTPHRGTHAARFTGGPLMAALRRDSELMSRLDADHPWERSPRLVCFWSSSDPLMQPARTATIQGADNREVPGFSHLDWLMRRRAWMDVEAALRG